MEAYQESLSRFVYQTGMFMRPVITAARPCPMRKSVWPMPTAKTSACCVQRRWPSTTKMAHAHPHRPPRR